jgi:dTDP-glucose pyrophosphorylase
MSKVQSLLHSIMIAPEMTIRQAAQAIQDAQIKLVLVCDPDHVLLGTVTDGDIRRAVMHELDLDGPVTTVMNQQPKVSHRSDNPNALRSYMRSAVIRHLPVVDDDNRVVDLVLLDAPEDVVSQDAIVVLMAGGRGSRLLPLTESTPKPLLKIGSKPLLERQIEQFVGQGFRRLYISVNYLGHMIEDYLGDGSRFSAEISYIRETKPLGTAGALSLMQERDRPVVVVNGDIITKANFAVMLEYFREHQVEATMGVREFLYTVPFGCVRINGTNIVELEEKPTMRHLINAGIYVLSPVALAMLREDEHCDMPQLFKNVIDAGHGANTFPITEEWIDIGQKEDLMWAQKIFAIEDKLD